MDRTETLEVEIDKIKARNVRVEDDKAWETSSARKIIITIVTYLLVGAYLVFLGVNKPWLNALVPTCGFVLSTLTISFVKKRWLEARKK
ncbi:MAG: hypothetical protein WCI57_02840 [Candidatus Berkelbacteria bacterium]